MPTRHALLLNALALTAGIAEASLARAQGAPPTASYDEEPPRAAPPSTSPSVAPPPPALPPVTPPPPPAVQNPAPAPVPPAPAAPPPPPATAPPAPPAAAAPAPPSPVVYEPPPPPLKRPDDGLPAFSVRLDPLHWLFYGTLPIEIEAQVWRFISLELTPIFVTSEQPPTLKQSFGRDVSQFSNGLGALAGAAIGPGFWLNGRPNRGTVLRALYTNYSYRYESSDGDSLTHTERHLYAYIGSHSKWGVFTLASGVGLGIELNRQRRCFDAKTGDATSNCAEDELLLATPRGLADLRSWSYPVELMWRLSLGVAF